MANMPVPDYPSQLVIAGIKSPSLGGDRCDLSWDIKAHDWFFKSRFIRQVHHSPPRSRSYEQDHYLKYRTQILDLLEDEIEKECNKYEIS